MPSARITAARRSRSAVSCFAIDSCTSSGGRTSFSSTRVIFVPQGSVAASSTRSSRSLMSSRFDNVSSRSSRADRGADVGHRDVDDRRLKILHLVRRPARINHLIEDDAVDHDRGIVLGDDVLGGDLQHGFLHVDLAADPVDERIDQAQAWQQRDPIAAEPFDGPLVALRDRAQGARDHRQDDDRQHQQGYQKPVDQTHAAPPPRAWNHTPRERTTAI